MTIATQKIPPEKFNWRSLADDCAGRFQNLDLPEDLQIPSLPTALTRFMKAAEDPEVEMRALGSIIELDPGLTLDLLKYVNVASRGAGNPAKTPTQALLRLGIPVTRNYLISAGMKSVTLGFDSRLMNHRNFWNESLQRALFAQNAAKDLGCDPELAFMGGLLQDFILPILTNYFDSSYIEFLRRDSAETVTLCDWEEKTFGWNHAAVGASIARQWNLPDDLLCAIFYHHQMSIPLTASQKEVFGLFPVTLAALIPDQLHQEPTGISRLLDADARSEKFRLMELSRFVDEELEAICEGIDRPTCLTPKLEAAREKLAASAT